MWVTRVWQNDAVNISLSYRSGVNSMLEGDRTAIGAADLRLVSWCGRLIRGWYLGFTPERWNRVALRMGDSSRNFAAK
jgi:hypothetical protein